MAIYRGPGGPGDATADQASTAQLALTYANQSAASAAAAAASAQSTINFTTDLDVAASSLPAGSTPTVSYNSTTVSLSFGIPNGATGPTGPGVAIGGTTGQYLKKASNTNYDTTWDTPTGGQFEGAAANKAIFWNAQSIAENITITGTHNAGSIGPITIDSGYAVTVNSGAIWVVI
jgi:hypothetical protein